MSVYCHVITNFSGMGRFYPWCSAGARFARARELHYKFGENISSDISYTEYSYDLNLGESLCIFTSFHFPDSGLYLSNSFDVCFDLF